MFAVRCAADILAFGGYNIGCDVAGCMLSWVLSPSGYIAVLSGPFIVYVGHGCTVLVASRVIAFVLCSPRVRSPRVCFAGRSA